jgi:ATP-dependent DNA ligase
MKPRSVLKTTHWVEPRLRCEVAFTEWTEDGRTLYRVASALASTTADRRAAAS